ncbi:MULTISPECIES: acyltransferase family protein [unclassified Paraflavitalea]|uniref:acyltransferase family protein n=1 Tax=unclassified Paraflavitalea TaxID=2798305 RepID=UPI003D354B47
MRIRVNTLDVFRFIAILLVALYHYFFRWTELPNVYPYGNQYARWFNHGNLGVQFFFMISGFVIYYTLENTNSRKEFFIKRWVRLFPSMLVASLLTYLLFICFDTQQIKPESHSFSNLLYSLTFLEPGLLNVFDSSITWTYLSGSYWSLWPEIQFYVLAALLFFYNKEKFLRNFTMFSFLVIIANQFIEKVVLKDRFGMHLPELAKAELGHLTLRVFTLMHYIQYFLFGSLMYRIYQTDKRVVTKQWFFYAAGILAIVILWAGKMEWQVKFLLLFFVGLFYLLSFRKIDGLGDAVPVLTKQGASSYFFYLIHEHLGILLISKTATFPFADTMLYPILVIILLGILSVQYTKFIEKRFSKFLLAKFLK